MKEIEGFENYCITEDGRVWSRNRHRFLVGGLDTDGYVQHVLCRPGGRKTWKAHRLVALAFIPNPGNLPVINHINGIKTDNRVENLEWCTVSHNTKHAYKLGALSQKGEANNSAKYPDSVVREVINGYDGGNIAEYSRRLGIPYAVVYSFIKQIRRFR